MNFEDRDVPVIVVLALLAALAVLTVIWGLVRKMLRTGRLSAPKAIILAGCFLFLLSGLFPPWLYTRSGHTERSAGYCFLLTAPQPRTYSNSGVRLDTERLAIEWLCILAGTGMVLMLVARSGGGREAAEAAESDKHAATTPPPAAGNRKPFSSIKRWIVIGTMSALLVFVIALLSHGIDQAKIIEQARAKADKDAQLQQEREQQWQERAAQETKRSQKAEAIVKKLYEEQSQKRTQEADSIAQAHETQRSQKAASIEREKAKWKSLLVEMSPQQVQEILGRPDGVSTVEYIQSVTWQYNHLGVGYVSFSHGVVSGWSAPVVYY